MVDVSDDKIELEVAMQEFLEHEKKKEFSLNSKKSVKKRKPKEENIFFINNPVGTESS